MARRHGLDHVERFFAPDGILETFYNDNLKLFLEDHPEHVGDARRASLVRRDVVAFNPRRLIYYDPYGTWSGPWTGGGGRLLDTGGRVTRFKKKFEGFGF